MNILNLDKLYIILKYCTALCNEEPDHLFGPPNARMLYFDGMKIK